MSIPSTPPEQSELGLVGLGSSAFALSRPKDSWEARRGTPDTVGQISALGTTVNIRIIGESGGHLNDAIACAFREIAQIEELMTTHDLSSPLSAVNLRAGSELLEVDARIIEVARAAIIAAERSGGLFDPTVLPLLKAWGMRETSGGVRDSVEEAASRVGFQGVSIEGNKLGLERTGAGLDFGAIAKGYAVDRAVRILRGFGVRNAIVEAGGDLYAMGKPEDAAGWRIGVKHPTSPGICAVFELADAAVATSGNYENKSIKGTRAPRDTFNPRTGEPVDTFLSVTARAATCMEADAASTVLFCGGKAVELARAGSGISSLNIQREGSGIKIISGGDFPNVERIG